MIAGGIGVTPVIALLTALHSGVMHPGRLSDVYFFWSFRDLSTLECFAREVAEVAASSEIRKPGKALHVAPIRFSRLHHWFFFFFFFVCYCLQAADKHLVRAAGIRFCLV
jgi:NAD(P)H-flavin reductase